ncbi:MAG: 1-deoxy-D-xylulose-5-phosphate reductoisomerase [Dehalococcoidia bacterium]|nr:1-deoxy-D-xylulose-5-phosphate reductoisomerase [Dehalococcoidia bacterium]
MGNSVIRLAILGSTGSVGEQTLDVVRALPGRFQVVALAAGGNVARLREQIAEFHPSAAWALPGVEASALASELGHAAWQPMEAMAARPDIDVVLVATSGRAGLEPTLAALAAGKAVALANKEVLVVGGHAVRAVLDRGGSLRPVDSEHSAIWQCLWGEAPESVARITLTASGGAFRDYDLDRLALVTPAEALQHPTWRMGPKVTIDSATLFNKGMEAIEARWLFDLPMDRIDVLQHRESVVHSLVTFTDGSVKAQLGEPDMRLPIQCALTYPERASQPAIAPLDLAARGALHFGSVDTARFPALAIAIEAGRRDDTTAAALSGADEVAVERFLAGGCRFTDIAHVLGEVLERHSPQREPNLAQLLDAEAWGRSYADAALSDRALKGQTR